MGISILVGHGLVAAVADADARAEDVGGGAFEGALIIDVPCEARCRG